MRDAWRNCLQRGEVPGAYWALMTHPAVTPALRQLAFGEVHMLSHLAEARSKGDQARAERDALEAHLAPPQERLQPLALVGKRIVYVGGRPHSTQAIQQMVHAAGGELVVHDGGIEDRLGLLVATLGRADLVVFPVDCIAHNPVSVLKRTCERHGVPYLPLRSAGIASFAAAMAERARREAPDSACCPSPSHFCLRHG